MADYHLEGYNYKTDEWEIAHYDTIEYDQEQGVLRVYLALDTVAIMYLRVRLFVDFVQDFDGALCITPIVGEWVYS